MNITHHPSDVTLAAFASEALDDGCSLVIAAHLSFCFACRKAIRNFEGVGGALLDRLEPASMRVDALERALTRLGEVEPLHTATPRAPATGDLPPPLSEYALGPWRWIGRGVQWRSVDVSTAEGGHVFMLNAAPGTRVAHHRHAGTEWTCVLEGAFRHGIQRYGPGDFDEADETVEHRPVVEDGCRCVCLVALQGALELQSWLGRLLQPLVRI
jgi:putative transcriptional regulator